ncbi:hypothetical protein [Nocardia testacea]|uniref:hypothetical protein n=1 Tax=Nocardia testacea TaxID=248551 RepID=UPI003A8B2FDE
MITVLAQQAQANSAWWSTWAVPIGVVTGSLIAGFITWRTSRKSPHDKLEQLVNVLKDMPEDIPGRDTVVGAIQLTLAEIRRTDQLDEILKAFALSRAPTTPEHPATPEEKVARANEALMRALEKLADVLVMRRAQTTSVTNVTTSLGFGLAVGSFTSLAVSFATHSQALYSSAVGLMLGAAVVMLAGSLWSHWKIRESTGGRSSVMPSTGQTTSGTVGASSAEAGKAPDREPGTTEPPR